MISQTITNIEYFRAASQQKPRSTFHGVNVHRDQKIVVVKAFDSLQDNAACVRINFAEVSGARNAEIAIKQQYGSGRKDDGRLEQAILSQNVTSDLLANIVDRTFGNRPPMFLSAVTRR